MSGFFIGAAAAAAFAALAYVVYDANAIPVVDVTADRSVVVEALPD